MVVGWPGRGRGAKFTGGENSSSIDRHHVIDWIVNRSRLSDHEACLFCLLFGLLLPASGLVSACLRASDTQQQSRFAFFEFRLFFMSEKGSGCSSEV
jgi:hypothetical protein